MHMLNSFVVFHYWKIVVFTGDIWEEDIFLLYFLKSKNTATSILMHIDPT